MFFWKRRGKKSHNIENGSGDATGQGIDGKRGVQGSMVRYHMKFLGQVQGVGFRWQVRMAAQSLRLTGWVVNNWDGSVEMEIQGDEASIGELLRSLQEDRYIRIDEIQKESIPLDEKEGGFKVRY